MVISKIFTWNNDILSGKSCPHFFTDGSKLDNAIGSVHIAKSDERELVVSF